MTNNNVSATQSTPPVGGFCEIDGRNLYVHKSGTGGPAVVLLPGASAIGLDYYLIQQEVAEFTTAVTYDRGGSGFSDAMPLPRSAEAVATELYELLKAQEVPGPYVLVAHSLGGAYAQRFAQLYPNDVAGLVWVDAFHSEWDTYLPAEAGFEAGEKMQPTREQLEQSMPFMRDALNAVFAEVPEQLRQALVDYHLSDTWISVGIAERGSMVAMAAELNAGPGLPDVPFIALTPTAVDPAQQALMSEELMQQVHDGKVKAYEALANSVSNGEHRVFPDANHTDIVFKRADAVVQAVRDIIERAAK